MAETRTIKLRVLTQASITSWRQGSGETTLYRVDARDEEGRKPDIELRTFSELPTGELIEYQITRYEHPEHGVSWTIKRPGLGSTKRIEALEGSLADLARRMSALEERFGEPEGQVHPSQSDPDHPKAGWGL